MQELDDQELLARFVTGHSETAFAALVDRYLNLVYSASCRATGNPSHAEEVSQAVFILFARKAAALPKATILSGWLYQAARLTSLNWMKSEFRRQRREQEVFMQSTFNPPSGPDWEQVAPFLEEAMGHLGEVDRTAVVMRYFENKTASEVAAALHLTEAAAAKRLTRALEKLRKIFQRRGVTLTVLAIAGTMAANSVQAAPPGLAASVASAAVGAGSSTTLGALIKSTMNTMTWMKLKSAAGLLAGIAIVGGALTLALAQGTDTSSPSTGEIMTRTREAYAALTSYSDEGTMQSSVGQMTLGPGTFHTRLGRPNLYRIDWVNNNTKGSVWSAGNGDFLLAPYSTHPEKCATMETALSSATGISGDAAGSIPGTFFKMNWGNITGGVMIDAKREADQKIDGVDCYVLSAKKKGITRTFWIGKKDSLVRQIKTQTDAASLKATLEEQAKKHPEMNLPTSVAGDVTSIQIHRNIVLNTPVNPADFESKP